LRRQRRAFNGSSLHRWGDQSGYRRSEVTTVGDKPPGSPYLPDAGHLVLLAYVRPRPQQQAEETARRLGRKTTWWLKQQFQLPPEEG